MIKIADISAIIFDMDGLVLDTESTYCYAKQQAARMMGYALPDHFWLSLSGLHHHEIQKKLLAYFGSELNLLEFNEASDSVWRDYVSINGIRTKHGFIELLAFITDQQIPFCLATNSNSLNARNCLKLAGLQDVFPIIITQDDVMRGKPEPDIFLKAAETLQVNIKKCLVLEDSLTGIIAASCAKAFAVFVPSQLPEDSVALSLCDMMVPDLGHLLAVLRA